MLKRTISFLLALCLCIGITAGTEVYAGDDKGTNDEENVGIGKMEDGDNSASEETIDLPQNGAKVQMDDSQLQIMSLALDEEEESGNEERYTVLVLDNSSSSNFVYNGGIFYTANTALPQVKTASGKFVKDIQSASGNNYVAVVSYRNNISTVVSPFTKDTDSLVKAINSLSAYGSTRSVYNGLSAAEKLIDSVENPAAVKNVVLFSTGMTNDGVYSYSGHYNNSVIGGEWYRTDTGISLYAYANKAYEAAERLKEKATVYSIGLFNTMENMPQQGRNVVQFFKLCACDWASSKNCFYDVKNPDELEFVFGEVAGSIVKQTGTFSYPGTGRDYTSTYYYDDNYFKDSSYKYNQQLATMSLCFELSSWGSEAKSDYTRKMENAEELLNELGFIGFDHNYTDACEEGITGKPTKDSIGVVAANKELVLNDKEYTLIALAVRGGGYEREWASNFTIGENGAHEGFTEAKNKVIEFLEKYIVEHDIDGDIKIWITGYSRAAATANLVAGALDDGVVDLGSSTLRPSDLYAYTFETPAGALVSQTTGVKYNNIFNIINRADAVPRVAPQKWDFDRYGCDRYIPSKETEGEAVYQARKSKMLKLYQKLEGYEGYIIDDFTMKKVVFDPSKICPGGDAAIYIADDEKNDSPQSAFLENYINILVKEGLGKRESYVKSYQSGIRDACGIFFGTSSGKKEALEEAVERKLKNRLALWLVLLVENGIDDVYDDVVNSLKACLDEAGITNYSKEEFNHSVDMIVKLVLKMAVCHPNLTVSLISNMNSIGQAHFPELCLAWMQSMDINYTTDAGLGFSSGKYRIIRINCPVDVTVCDSDGNVLTTIINDTPQKDGELAAAFNEDGEKLVYLPVNEDYVVKLTATGDGTMNYGIQEIDPQAGESNHIVNFNDILISKGQEYVAYLPGYSLKEIEDGSGEAAKTKYTLFLDDKQILPDEELSGKDAFDAYYYVDAVAADETNGYVFGGGTHQLGTFTKLTAVANQGYEFVGWYADQELVSKETEYRIRVSKDVKLVAVFKPIEEGNGIQGSFKVVSQWNDGFNGEITLANETEEVIHNWMVKFDLPYEITNMWNGSIVSYENGVYTVRNASYNWDINPGESVTIGFTARWDAAEEEKVKQPNYYNLVRKNANTVTENLEITYKVNSDWETAFNGEIRIKNTSSSDMSDWMLEFDFDGEIKEFWNAEIVSHEGKHYVIKNKGYNATIGAGQTLVLGFETADGNGTGKEPSGYQFTTVNLD